MRGVNDEVFLLLVWFFTGNEKECNEAPSTVLTVLLVYLFFSSYSPVVIMLMGRAEGDWSARDREGEGGCSPVLMK